MKRLLIISLMICAMCHIQAQNSQVKVTLKSGVVIKGELKEFNPVEYVVVKVAGIESKILMDKVESVEELSSNTTGKGITETQETFDTKLIGNYLITDNALYPESFELNLDGQTIKMLLVRGGTFNMGYDGDGSLGMKSEPIHQVNLSSYYISEQCIKEEAACKLLSKIKGSYKDKYYSTKWKNAQQIVEKIAEDAHKPYRLLTEAEWEYATLMPNAYVLWGKDKVIEWCSDFYGKYNPSLQTNPKGPSSGNSHVYRSYNLGKNKWDRIPIRFSGTGEALIRIAISADAIK